MLLNSLRVNQSKGRNFSFFVCISPSVSVFVGPCHHGMARGKVQVNQDGLKLNGTHQLLAYADNVNILGGSIHTVKENAEALVVATRENGLEVNAGKTKYMVMS